MSSMPWLRLYNEIRNDAKIKRIARLTSQSKFMLVGVWVTILVLANESPRRGKLLISNDIPMTYDDILDELGLDTDIFKVIWDSFINMEMIAVNEGVYEVSNWDKRQFASDNVAARMRKSRAKKRNGDEPLRNSDVTVTSQVRHSDVIDSDSDSDSESNINEAELDKKWGGIFSLYSNNINISESPLTIQEMQSDEFFKLPFEWWQQAIKIAGDRNIRKWSYVRGVLNKSIERGISPDKASEEMSNGKNPSAKSHKSSNSVSTKPTRSEVSEIDRKIKELEEGGDLLNV